MSLLDTASLIVTPNGYKEGKLYSVIPSDGSGDLSVTRATTATRVNSAGLVELVPYNLFTYSEDFANAAWSKNVVTITSNATTAPDGTTTADKIIIDSGSQDNPVVFEVLDSNTSTRTLSFYAKASEYNIAFARVGGAANAPIVLFSLTGSGSILHNQNALSYSIEALSNGWYRCSMTYAHGTSFAPNVGVCSPTYSVSATSVTSTGNGTSGIFIWGAQLNEGTIKTYQKTETRLNIPRLDYSNGTCPSLLVEPQRTNLATYSEDLAQTLPFNERGTITANNTTAPSGISNADKFTINTAYGTHYLYNGYTATNGQSYTTSIFLKAGTGRYFLYRILTNANAYRFGVTIDLQTGTILSENSTGSPTGTSSKIEDYGNGWYRVSLTINGIGVLLATLLETSNTATPALDSFLDYEYTGNGTDSYYIWGNQIEAGSYATSYIPTTSASVTRNADVISKTGISSLIGQTEGTIFLDLQPNNTGSVNVPIRLDDTTSNNRIQFEWSGATTANLLIASGGSWSVLALGISLVQNQHSKIAIGYKANDFVLYVNGSSIYSNTSGAVPVSLTDIKFYETSSSVFSGDINAAALWKTRLTNTQLQALTTI